MRIRVLSPQLSLSPDAVLGGEVYDREILKGLGGLGVKVRVIVPGAARVIGHPDITVIRTCLPSGFRWPISNLVFPGYIKAAWDQEPFDVLRIHSPRFTGLGCIWATRRWGLDPVIVADHYHLERKPAHRAVEKWVLERSDMVIVPSSFSRSQLVADTGINAHNICVVYPGVGPEFGTGPKDTALARRLGLRVCKTVLYLGSLSQRKDVGTLLRMAHHFLFSLNASGRYYDDFQLVIAGEGPERRRLERLANRLGIHPWTVFLGHVAESDKAELYRLCDIFVSASLLEGFGMTTTEAMATGKPVVVTQSGPALEVVGDAGILVGGHSSVWMARQVNALMSNPGLARELGIRAQRRVRRMFNWEVAARTTVEAYRETMLKRQGGD